MAAATQERRTDFGPPHYEQFLHPIIKKNYGTWKYHEVIKPGVMVHVAESGDKIFTVRAGSPRLLSVDKIRAYCDLADKYCAGHLLRFGIPSHGNQFDGFIIDLFGIYKNLGKFGLGETR